MQKFWASVEWWEAATIIGLLVLSWGGSWLLNRFLAARLHRQREANAAGTGVAVLQAFVPLVRWGLFLAAIAVALQMVELPELVAGWFNTGLEAAFTLLTASAAGAAVTVMFRHWAKRPQDPAAHRTRATMAPVLAKSCKIFFYIIAGLLILQNGGYNVAGLLAGLGIGGLAVALAGKETLANLFGSIAVLVDRPFQVGDTIRQGDTEGAVEKIGLRSTRVRTGEGFLVSIPNQIITTSPVVNISARPAVRQQFTLALVCTLSADQMRQAVEIVRGIFAAHPQTRDAWVYWKDFGESSLDIQVTYWSKAPAGRQLLAALEELNLEIKAKLDAAGFGFAFPTRTVLLENVGTQGD